MSPSAERRSPGGDGGFTLIEVLVSIAISVTVLTALLPQLVVGIRSSEVSRQVTQAKAVAQGQLERMRNLPYHVEPDAGDYRDVLDYYLRDTTPAPTFTCTDGDGFATPAEGEGLVPDGTARCSYEPAGDLYRYVRVESSSGFTVVVDAQFLSTPATDGTSTVVSVPAHYDTQVDGRDNPASSQIGVTVTVLYDRRGTTHPVTSYTQIADQPATETRLKATATATAVSVGSVTAANGGVSLDVGLLYLSGSLGFASTAGATLAGASGGLSTGEKAEGAPVAVSAPETAASVPGSAGGLSGTCTLACWGSTQSDVGAVTATNGLPNVGSAAAPMQARLTGNADPQHGLSFDNGDLTDYRAGLDLSGPLVRLDPSATETTDGLTDSCALSSTGLSGYVRSLGYLRSVDDGSPEVESCAVSSSAWVSLFPTGFAPRGVLRIRLVEASARCQVTGSTHTAATPTVDYEAVVSRYAGPGDDDYETVATITPVSTGELPDPATVPLGSGHTLDEYVASWAGVDPTTIDSTAVGGVSAVQLPGVFTMTSQPVRTSVVAGGDPTSAVSFTVGETGCFAEDAR